MPELPKTLLTQEASSYEDTGGTIHFKIENGLSRVHEGDLPYAEVFLHQVEVPNDPKADVFLRIATLTDLTAETRGRDAALALGKKTYLDSHFLIEFSDLDTAVQGKQVIQARIDDLISQWKTYQEKFTSPSTYEMPLADTSVVSAAKIALVKALTDLETKEKTLEELKADLKVKQTAATDVASRIGEAQTRSDECASLNAILAQVYAGENAFRQSVIAFISDCRVFDSQASQHQGTFSEDLSFPGKIADFEAAVVRGDVAVQTEASSARGLLEKLVSQAATQCAKFQTDVTSARLRKQAADAAVAAAQTKVVLAEAEVTAAQAVADAALVTVSNYCPLFDPAKDL